MQHIKFITLNPDLLWPLAVEYRGDSPAEDVSPAECGLVDITWNMWRFVWFAYRLREEDAGCRTEWSGMQLSNARRLWGWNPIVTSTAAMCCINHSSCWPFDNNYSATSYFMHQLQRHRSSALNSPRRAKDNQDKLGAARPLRFVSIFQCSCFKLFLCVSFFSHFGSLDSAGR